ncbi:hypothetical protein CLSAP_09760 [Clostridium saccharoperbutylacetonicum]|nr:hypothetical protein CLSAP_09760 [Clostridium saccharoperbutylacetonicum]NSB29368.1 hypothetical protein [Clostridium saccharoperbutylacetonicum]
MRRDIIMIVKYYIIIFFQFRKCLVNYINDQSYNWDSIELFIYIVKLQNIRILKFYYHVNNQTNSN